MKRKDIMRFVKNEELLDVRMALNTLIVLSKDRVEHSIIDWDMGICYNLTALTQEIIDCYEFVAQNCIGWNGIESHTYYPIVNNADYIKDIWKSPFREMRVSLMEHLIGVIDKHLEDKHSKDNNGREDEA